MFMKIHSCIVFGLLFLSGYASAQSKANYQRASQTLDSIYAHFAVPNEQLFREHYPYDNQYKADYLGGGENANRSNPYSYLWPFSGVLSAQVARYETKKDKKVKQAINEKVWPGLDMYYDKRQPYGYASYINTARRSDRFYDDNVWLGIDFTDLYLLTKEQKYLNKAKEIWAFVASGMDDKLGGGIYWCEQRKESKNTCSNAPGTVFLLKLYEATKDKAYLTQGMALYDWTKNHLQDSTDYLYFDNIKLDGRVDKRKYSYNSGQMLQAATLLYKATGNNQYLKDAQNIAASSHAFFFEKEKNSLGFHHLKDGNQWFLAVMLRGFVELYHVDKNKAYLTDVQRNLDFAWNHMREENGLFNKDWRGENKTNRKWVLDQFAMVEMYARMGKVQID